MQGLRHELIPANGVEHAVFINLSSPSSISSAGTPGVVHQNLVVARSNLLRIFEIREELAPLPSLEDAEAKAASGASKLGTEAVEGEVVMDTEGDGFVNMDQMKSLPAGASITPTTVTRLHLLREHRLHGIVTGLGSVKTLASSDDGLDRLLLSFRDAKLSILEWSDHLHDITTLSIHTYERAPQVLTFSSPTWRATLRVDPSNRCAALSLPKDAFAILPFHTAAELEMMDQERGLNKDVPYSPSFVLDLNDVDAKIKNVLDFAFVPGFNNPTVAVAFQTTQTWTGRLNELKDSVSVYYIALDILARSYPVISQITNMPYDVLYMVPCPAFLGGVLLVTPNAILHVDQTSRTVGIAVNGWANRVSGIILPVQSAEDNTPMNVALEGSHLRFIRDDSIALFLADGTVRQVWLHLEGRSVSRIEVSPVIAQTTLASTVCLSGDNRLFLGSMSGPSMLLSAQLVEEVVEKTGADPEPVIDELDMELDEEIYGDVATQAAAAKTTGVDINTVTALKLAYKDCLPGHGIISHLTFGLNNQETRPLPELVACTGVAPHAGLTRFTDRLPTRSKRKIPAVGGSQGIWSMHVKRSGSGASKNNADGRDTLIVSTNATPAPGISRIITSTSGGDVHILGRTPGVTVAAGPFFQNTRLVQVMTDSIRIVDSDGRERLLVKDSTGDSISAKIVEASVHDPYVLVRREDNSVSLYTGDTMSGKLTRNNHASLPSALSVSLFTDHDGNFHVPSTSGADDEKGDAIQRLEDILDSDRGTQWILLLTVTGVMQVLSIPHFTGAFATPSIITLPAILSAIPPEQEDKDADQSPSVSEIDQLAILPIGEASNTKSFLLALTTTGLLTVYEILPSTSPTGPKTPSGDTSIPFRFAKVFSRLLEEQPSGVPPHRRQFIPFTMEKADSSYTGVLCTGYSPFWLLKKNWSPIRMYPAVNSFALAFTPCSLFGARSDFLGYTDEGPTLMQWVGDVELGFELPYREVLVGRQYTSVVFDAATEHYVAVSSQKSKFTLFDDENNRVWTPDAPGVSDPVCESSALELFSPDTWTVIDGYEFAHNEFVNAAESVSLETLSAEKGQKDFVVVGTTIYRGEDLAVKGATYVFEVIEVVREPGSPKRRHKLKLLCRDEAKGPVTAVCGMNGYLVSSMGQKIFVRAFDLDERLIGMAFLDVGLYVTSLTNLKNLLLITDSVKSVWFVCFQEDPFKLVVLAKDPEQICAQTATFFFGGNGDLSIVSTDDTGVIRIYNYDPQDPESNSGERLLCRTEFDAQTEHHTALTIARRAIPVTQDVVDEEDEQMRDEDRLAQAQSVLVFGTYEGSVSVLSPIDTAQYKRLSLLQGQLLRNVQHVAALNPRAFRTVPNEKVSRPLTKGILDGTLLDGFLDLSIDGQAEMTKQIGTERSVLLNDLRAVWRAW